MKLSSFSAVGCAMVLAWATQTVQAQWFNESLESYGSYAGPLYCNPTSDSGLFQAAWPATPNCGFGHIESGYNATNCATGSGYVGGNTPPFLWTVNKSASQQQWRSLIPAIQAVTGNPSMNAVNGTDANPLVLHFAMYLKDVGGGPATSAMWVQLFSGPVPEMGVPTTVPGIGACVNGFCDAGPMAGQACTSDEPCTAMKLERTGDTSACVLLTRTPVVNRPAIAYGVFGGANGLIPKPPCINLVNREVNNNVLYDGNRWYQLTSTTPPASLGSAIIPGRKTNWITLTIYSTSMSITQQRTDVNSVQCVGGFCNSGVHAGEACGGNAFCRTIYETKTNIARSYTGPFQSIAIGPGAIRDGTDSNLVTSGTETPSNLDDIWVDGGEFSALPVGACCQPNGTCFEGVLQAACDQQGGTYAGDGTTCATANCGTGACCLPNATCSQQFATDCTNLGGTFNGVNSLCANAICCHTPFADTDGDSDVDVDDFGTFQRCYTGSATGVPAGCACLDKVASNPPAINEDDLTAFTNCYTRSGVKWVSTPGCP